MTVVIGTKVGSYKITKELGEGGMGAVYLAEHELMGKQAAVKVLLPQYCTMPEVVERFFNEAKSASLIKHPGIVDIYDFGKQEDGSAFIVMELLEGEELAELLQRNGNLPSDRVALLGQQMAVALAAAHKIGVIHRDLKPENIYLEPDEAAKGGVRPKILDFGIAKLTGEIGGSTVKTRTGAIMGTPVFMSPEQCTGAGEIDHRSDIYSLGCILYNMVCGRPPFVADGVGALIAAHINNTPDSPRAFAADIDTRLEEVIMLCLAKSPDERPQNMEALAEMLAGIDGSVTASVTAQVGAAGPAHPRANTNELFGQGGGEDTMDPRFSKTTLGSSAGAVNAREAPSAFVTEPRSRKGLLFGGIALAAAGAVAAFVLTSGGEKAEPQAAAGTVPSEAKSAPDPDLQPGGETPPIATLEDPQPADIELTIDSEPQGARVYNVASGIKLGVTPYVGTYPVSEGELELRIAMAGYEPQLVSVPLRETMEKHVALVAVAKAEEKDKKRGKKGRRNSSKEDRKGKTVEAKKPEPKVEPKPAPKPEPKPEPKPKKTEPKKTEWGELAS